MRLSNPSSSDLGTYTWSQLQSAFPNGGAALAELPYSATAVVTDIGKAACKVTPNLAKTRWIPFGGAHRLMQYAGSKAAPVTTWSGATGKWSPGGGDVTIPAGVLAASDMLEIRFDIVKRGANATARVKLRIGTTGTYATDAIITDITLTNSDLREYRGLQEAGVTASALWTTDWLIPGNQNTGASSDQTGNWSISSAMYAIVECASIHASDFVDLIFWRMEWRAAP